MGILERLAFVALVSLPVLLATSANTQDEGNPIVIEEGRQVSIEYTLTVDGETVADTNAGGEPLVYEHGKGQIPPALESALVGLAPGDSKQVALSPEEGFGPVDPKLFESVPTSAVPEDARRAGAQLVAESPNGQRLPVRVHEVKADEIVIDRNHPLAGKALDFDIRILSVE